MTALQPIYNLPIQYKQGGKITVASNTTLSISSLLTRSMADDLDINIGDYFGAATATVLDTAIVGFNGIDTGVLQASKVYAVHAIADEAGYNPAGFLLSLSATAPQLPNGKFPSGYNSFVRVGWAVTDATVHFTPLTISGLGSTVKYTYDVPVLVLNAGTSATQAPVDLSAVVPAVAGIPVDLGGDFVSDTAGKKATVCTSGGTIASSRFIYNAQVASVHVIQDYLVPATLITGAPKVDYIISAATSSLSLYVNGFTDYLL
jgi:hypothetical protein